MKEMILKYKLTEFKKSELILVKEIQDNHPNFDLFMPYNPKNIDEVLNSFKSGFVSNYKKIIKLNEATNNSFKFIYNTDLKYTEESLRSDIEAFNVLFVEFKGHSVEVTPGAFISRSNPPMPMKVRFQFRKMLDDYHNEFQWYFDEKL